MLPRPLRVTPGAKAQQRVPCHLALSAAGRTDGGRVRQHACVRRRLRSCSHAAHGGVHLRPREAGGDDEEARPRHHPRHVQHRDVHRLGVVGGARQQQREGARLGGVEAGELAERIRLTQRQRPRGWRVGHGVIGPVLRQLALGALAAGKAHAGAPLRRRLRAAKSAAADLGDARCTRARGPRRDMTRPCAAPDNATRWGAPAALSKTRQGSEVAAAPQPHAAAAPQRAATPAALLPPALYRALSCCLQREQAALHGAGAREQVKTR